MATTLQLRRGTATEAAAFTGAVGELFIDTQNKLVYLHDGVTAGGVLVGGSGGSGSAVVSGTVSGNTLTLTNSDSSTVNINVATLAQDTDTNTYVTSATVSGSVITLHNNNGSTVDIQLPSSATGFLPGEVMEDMVPGFDSVYDLGTTSERWYDAYLGNKLDINTATLVGSMTGSEGSSNTTVRSGTIFPSDVDGNIGATTIGQVENGYPSTTTFLIFVIGAGASPNWQTIISDLTVGTSVNVYDESNTLAATVQVIGTQFVASWNPNAILVPVSGSVPWLGMSGAPKLTWLSEVTTVVPDTREWTLASNATLVAPSVAADTSLIGGLFTDGSTITPEHILGAYTDTKGTLTVDGNLIVADNLNVSNKIALKQLPQTVGAVTGFDTTPAEQTSVYLTDTTAQAAGIREIYFTQGASTHTMYFSGVQQAAAFNEQFTVGLQVTFGLYVAGQGAFTTTVNIATKTYSGGDYIEFAYNYVSGIEFNQFANWTHWYFPWYSSGQTYQMSSIQYELVTPATYAVQFDNAVPVLTDVNKLFINGVSTIDTPKTYANLTNFSTEEIGYNEAMYLMNFNFYNDATFGNGLQVSTMGSQVLYYNFFTTLDEVNFVSNVSGTVWKVSINNADANNAGPYGTWLSFNVISTSNPSYPTPASYASSFSANDMGVSFVAQTDIKTTLVDGSTSVGAINKYTSNTDIRSLFTVGDALTYTTKTTKLVFGDETSVLSKAITYDETTGAIAYDGLVTAINLNATTNALSSANAYPNTAFGNNSVSLGYYAKASEQRSTAVGPQTSSEGVESVAVGYNARAYGESSVCVGSGKADGSYSTYVGRGGEGMGNMYHTTVLGMIGQSSSGWMWASGRHVMALGLENCYIGTAGDYATVINGGGGNYVNSNLLGGSTWFAPQNRHAEITLSVYQYKYSNGAATIYPQLGYTSNTAMPMDIPTSGSSSATSALDTKIDSGLIAQGKVTVTVQRRNSDDYGIYEITFVTRNNNAGTASIVQQATTVVAQSGAATYWNNPVMYLHNSRYLQLSLTTTASSANNYITVHVGGDVRMNGVY